MKKGERKPRKIWKKKRREKEICDRLKRKKNKRAGCKNLTKKSRRYQLNIDFQKIKKE